MRAPFVTSRNSCRNRLFAGQAGRFGDALARGPQSNSAHDRAASGQTRGSTTVNSLALEHLPFRQRLGGRLLQPSAAVDGCGSLLLRRAPRYQELVDQRGPIPVLAKEVPDLCFGGRIRCTEVAQMPKKPPKKKVKSKPKA